jgi:hypothetical protein
MAPIIKNCSGERPCFLQAQVVGQPQFAPEPDQGCVSSACLFVAGMGADAVFAAKGWSGDRRQAN